MRLNYVYLQISLLIGQDMAEQYLRRVRWARRSQQHQIIDPSSHFKKYPDNP